MKTKIATALSIVGVLSAGSAAALVNTQILDSGPSEATASAAVLPPASTVDLTVPDTAAPTTTIDDDDDDDATYPTVATTVAAPATVPTIAPAASQPDTPPMLTAFNVGTSGVVTVDVVGGKLLLVDAEANPGWTVARSVESSPTSVDVEFLSATVRVMFTAVFADGQIKPSVTSAAVPAPTTTSPSGSDYDDDHDDDEYEDDDHDDEYEDDEYEDDDRDDEDDDRDDEDDGDHDDD
jgi:hypothetical protein